MNELRRLIAPHPPAAAIHVPDGNALIMEPLATAAFMEKAHNLILVGGTGTGKTHLATAIGVAAIHQSKRVRFFNASTWSICSNGKRLLARSAIWPSNSVWSMGHLR